MIDTEINITEELLKYFRNVKLPDTSVKRHSLLSQFWDPVLDGEPLATRMQAYLCLNSYEKAWIEFNSESIFLAQNTLDYADYHAYELGGAAKSLSDLHHNMVQALAYYENRQYDDAFITMEQSFALLDTFGAAALFPRMLCSLLLSDIQFTRGFNAGAAAVAASQINQWQMEDTGNISAEHRITLLHHVTNHVLNNIHDRFHHQPEEQSAYLDTVFATTASLEQNRTDHQVYNAAAGLLLQYHQPADKHFLEGITALLPLFNMLPVFMQYFLLQKTFRYLQLQSHPDIEGVAATLDRYYTFIHVTQLLNTRKKP